MPLLKTTPQVVKTGLAGHLVFQEVKNPRRCPSSTTRPFFITLPFAKLLYMHPLPKIEASSLHLQFMEFYQKSPNFHTTR